MTSTQIAYRQAAVEGANGFGLLVALYDTLIADLRRAAQAQRSHHLERRADAVNHAILVIGFMENWIDPRNGGELATWLLRFYAGLRSSLIVAQARQSIPMLQQCISQLLHLRAIWQELEHRPGELPFSSTAISQPLAGNALRASGTASSWTI